MEKKTFDALSKRLRPLFPIDEVMTTPVQAALLRLMLSELRPPRPKPEERGSARVGCELLASPMRLRKTCPAD